MGERLDSTGLTYFWGKIKSYISGKIVDNLTSTSATDALSANQGRVLDENKADKQGSSVTVSAVSGVSTVVSNTLKKYGEIVVGALTINATASANTDTKIGNIESGKRPNNSIIFPIYINSTGKYDPNASIEVKANGDVMYWGTAISNKQVSVAVSYHV